MIGAQDTGFGGRITKSNGTGQQTLFADKAHTPAIADMTNVATIEFHDADAQDEALILVRAEAGRVALAVSLKSDGDIQVVMPLEEAQTLIRSLQEAVVVAEKPS